MPHNKAGLTEGLANQLMAKRIAEAFTGLTEAQIFTQFSAQESTTTTQTASDHQPEALTTESIIRAIERLNPPLYYQTNGYLKPGTYAIFEGGTHWPDHIIIANADEDGLRNAAGRTRLRVKKLEEYRDGAPYAKIAEAVRIVGNGALVIDDILMQR